MDQTDVDRDEWGSRGKRLMVIGTFAYCGSGQDTLADGFCKYKGYIKYSLGDVIRDIALERDLPQKREVLQSIRRECDAKYGRTFIPDMIIKKISQRTDDKVIITGIRTIEECEIFKRKLGMFLIFVSADTSVRYKRMLKRAEEKDASTIVELNRQMEQELRMFDYGLLERRKDYEYRFDMSLYDYLRMEKKVITTIADEIQRIAGYEN